MNKFSYKSFFEFYIGLFLIFIILLPKLIALPLIGFLPLIVVGFLKKKIKFSPNMFAALFVALYIFYAVYAIFTRHPDLAAKYFENKLSFIIIPVLLSFKLKETFSFKIPLTLYVFGVFILIIQYFLVAFYCFSTEEGSKLCFLTSGFSFSHHPTYTNVYILFGMIILIFGYVKNFKFYSLKWIIPVLVLFLISYLLCLSLAGILFLFSLLAFLLLRFILSKWGKIAALSFTVLAPFLIYFSIISTPQIEGEWTNAKWYFDQYTKNPDDFVKNRKYPMAGTEVRIVMWVVSAKAIADFPLGVGTGNVDEVLAGYLCKLNQKQLAKDAYNPHNQYFQTFLELGVFGLLILVLILVLGVSIAFKEKTWILLILILNLAFNMIFESMLQRQDGIVFYTFVLNLLVIYPLKKSAFK